MPVQPLLVAALTVLALLARGPVQDPEPAPGPSVEILSLTATRAPTIAEPRSGDQDRLELVVGVVVPGREVIGVDTARSSLSRWKDDTGRDLTKGAPAHWLAKLTDAAPEHRFTRLMLTTRSLPDPEAARIALRASVALRVAARLAEAVRRFELADGAQFQWGQGQITVRNVEPITEADHELQYGDAKLKFELTSPEPMDAIRDIHFFDIANRRIQSRLVTRAQVTINGTTSYRIRFALAQSAKAVVAKIAFFGEVETLLLPLELDFGLGL